MLQILKNQRTVKSCFSKKKKIENDEINLYCNFRLGRMEYKRFHGWRFLLQEGGFQPQYGGHQV